MKNFGKIKNIFNTLLAEAIANKDVAKKKIFNKYVTSLKENEILRNQFSVYTSIENLIEENQFKASEKIKMNVDTLKSYKKEDIIEANNKLLKLAGDVNVDIKYDKESIHESISNLIFSDDINRYVDSLNEAIEYAKVNTPKEVFESAGIPNSILASIVVDKFNTKYNSLDESSKKLIKLIFEGTEKDKTNLFETSIKECLDLINNKLDKEFRGEDVAIKESLLAAKENLLGRTYIKESFEKDIVKILNLKNDLK